MTHAPLQLALGRTATLVERLPDDGALERHAARGPADGDRVTRMVVVHPPAPEGAASGALLDRMAALQALAHPGIAPPLATGAFDGRAWVVEPHDPDHLLSTRLATQGALSVQDTVRLLRDLARALAVMHRRNLSHGALTTDTVVLAANGAVLHALGRTVTFEPRRDLAGLGTIAVAALGGRSGAVDTAELLRRRPSIPKALAQLLDRLQEAASARVLPTAAEVLEQLDEYPTTRGDAEHGILDGVTRGARAPGQRHMAMLLAVTAVLMMLAWVVLR